MEKQPKNFCTSKNVEALQGPPLERMDPRVYQIKREKQAKNFYTSKNVEALQGYPKSKPEPYSSRWYYRISTVYPELKAKAKFVPPGMSKFFDPNPYKPDVIEPSYYKYLKPRDSAYRTSGKPLWNNHPQVTTHDPQNCLNAFPAHTTEPYDSKWRRDVEHGTLRPHDRTDRLLKRYGLKNANAVDPLKGLPLNRNNDCFTPYPPRQTDTYVDKYRLRGTPFFNPVRFVD